MVKRMDHVGISVANLERSIEFYRDLLGMEVIENEGFSGALFDRILALEGVTGKTAMLRHGSLQIELFEFLSPQPKRADPERPVCDHGITHFCIEVTQIEELYKRLSAAGIRFHCPPLDFPGSLKATYGRDPDGNVFELLQMPSTPNTTVGAKSV